MRIFFLLPACDICIEAVEIRSHNFESSKTIIW